MRYDEKNIGIAGKKKRGDGHPKTYVVGPGGNRVSNPVCFSMPNNR
ncbi:MAG: hypothetical protein JXB00_19280 [Bacteroidales bacterium]|nr:hypothetical protein [Bacteroidales bacterium]